MQFPHRRRQVTVVLVLAGMALLCAGAARLGAGGVVALSTQTGCGGADAERAPTAVELELLAAINAFRQARGLSALVPAPALMRAARWKAADLATTATGLLTTADLDDADRSWTMRLVDCGYPDSAEVGETLGQIPGGADADAVLQFWLDGDLNARLLLDPAWRTAGVGAVQTDAYTYWVLDLGDTAP